VFQWLFASPIHGFFLQKFNIAKYVAGIIIVWGGVLACHAACTNYTGLVVVRLVLGILEGGITPA
jgi:ACS family allantoate permease-like MFS transporter